VGPVTAGPGLCRAARTGRCLSQGPRPGRRGPRR
jgi:hypothetical protein